MKLLLVKDASLNDIYKDWRYFPSIKRQFAVQWSLNFYNYNFKAATNFDYLRIVIREENQQNKT